MRRKVKASFEKKKSVCAVRTQTYGKQVPDGFVVAMLCGVHERGLARVFAFVVHVCTLRLF